MTFERRSGAVRALSAMVWMAAVAATGAPPVQQSGPADPAPPPAPLSFGPVDGLTTAWHAAPTALPVPAGTKVYFSTAKRTPGDVSWTNAIEVYENTEVSIAVCPGSAPGEVRVRAWQTFEAGGRSMGECLVRSIDVALEDIEISTPTVAVGELPADPTNDEAVRAYFGDSIAAYEHANDGGWVTSVDNLIAGTVTVSPPEFKAIVEWRVDGAAASLGGSTQFRFAEPGTCSIEAGRPGVAEPFEVTMYRVVMLMPAAGEPLPTEGPITGIAITEPSGYEDRITWLAATKFGSAAPVVGRGPVFTTEFADIYGEDPQSHGGLWAWWGLKADNAKRGQDDKLFACGQIHMLGFRDGCGRSVFDPPPNGANEFFPIFLGAIGSNEEPCPLGGPQGGGIVNEKYPVTGDTLQEVGESMLGEDGAGPMIGGRRFAGSATLAFNPQWQSCGRDADGNIRVEVTSITWNTVVLLPAWDPPKGTAQASIDEWNRFRAALAVHENGHAAINDARMGAVRDAFVGRDPARKISVPGQTTFPNFDKDGEPLTKADATINDAINNAVSQAINSSPEMQALNQAQDNYDRPQSPTNPTGTNHGATQGATLNTSICWVPEQLQPQWLRVLTGLRAAA